MAGWTTYYGHRMGSRMEYDLREGCWYIEASKDNWMKLPDRYSTEGLWYIAD